MIIKYLEESLLQFGVGQSVCPKDGISNFGPYDIDDPTRPEKIKLGVVGSSESVAKILEWLTKCKAFIHSKEDEKGNLKLYPHFLGFNTQVSYKSELVYDESYIRKINNSDFEEISKLDSMAEITEATVKLFLTEIRFLSQNKRPDVILCVLNEKFVKFLTSKDTVDEEDEKPEINDTDNSEEDVAEDTSDISESEHDFRRLLKASAMEFNVPIQIVRDRIAKPTSEMQDEATCAWNFFTALYYKASGTPWALVKNASAPSCYAGISFYRSRDKATTQTSIAQIFNEHGKGVILRGEPIKMKKDDKQPHLSEEQSFNLLNKSLTEYYDALKIFPSRLVVHKTSNFNEEEINGFTKAAKNNSIYRIDLITIMPSEVKLYREHDYPPLRGTCLSLNDKHHILYTRGSVDYFRTYPGKYIPSALEVRIFRSDESTDLILQEILSLSKMNWNNTQFDRKYPITIECARKVGEILKYLPLTKTPQTKYSFYM